MRKRLIIAVTFLGGVYFIVEFLLPEHFPPGFGPDGAWRGIKIREYHEEILTGLQSVGMAAIGLGLINIFRVFGVNVAKRRKGWPFSLTLVLAMLTMMFVTFRLWLQDLDVQHQVGPLGVQREFQLRTLNYVGRTPPNPPMGERYQKMREMALLRYLLDTRDSVSPPPVSTGDAATQLSALAEFLKGAQPAPGFFQVIDAPENPPEYGAPGDLLAKPAEPPSEPLATRGGDEQLAQLRTERDKLTEELRQSAEKIKALTGLDIGAAVSAEAAAVRQTAPKLKELARSVRALADEEHAVYTKPADFDARYVGAPDPPPPPMFGRLYLQARALQRSAEILSKYANVLDLAAIEIPASAKNQQDLTKWLEARAKDSAALRQDWQAGLNADLAKAAPEIRAKLSAGGKALDPLRTRMLADLEGYSVLEAAYAAALNEIEAADAALKESGDLPAALKKAADASQRALDALKAQEAALRQLRVRSVEQDLSYLDLADEDARKIILPELSAEAEAAPDVLQKVAAAAKEVVDALNARIKELQTQLDTAVAELRKTWKDKSSVELLNMRNQQDGLQKEIAALKNRVAVAANAQKLAGDAAAKAAALLEIQALNELVAQLPQAKSAGEAAARSIAARKAVVDGETFVLQHASRAMERFAFKHDMKELRALTGARDSAKAFMSAVQSDSLINTAAKNSRAAATALEAKDLPGARGSMETVYTSVAQSQEGTKDALQEKANRSSLKGVYKCLFDGLYVSLGAAMFSLLAFYIASAAYRAFRVKSAEALLMMLAALLVMLGQIPFGAYLWGSFPQVRLWMLQVFSTSAFRGIALGAAVAFLAMAMRMWLSLETSAFYREEDSGGEEGA